MILGASHITLGCENLDAAAANLAPYGYRPEFIERDVVNNPSKQSVLAAQCQLHGIGLLRSEHGFPIELVCYRDRLPESMGRYFGVFETTGAIGNAGDIEPDPTFSSLARRMGSTWEASGIAGLDVPAFFVRGPVTNAGLRQFVLPVSDLERSRRLWCDALGFRMECKTDDSVELHFVSPVAAWRLQMLLVASPGSEARPVLDAKGMACLSLLSSNVVEDVPRLIASGAELQTDIFDIPINGKNMKVAILADHDGAFIELLQIVRR